MKVHASLSGADPLRVGDALDRLLAAGVDGIHVDLCDGVFAPGLAGGVPLVAAVARRSPAPVWAHLMVAEPEPLVVELAAAGAAGVTVHVEATRYPARLAVLAGRLGLRLGFAVNPATPLAWLESEAYRAPVVSLLTTEPDGAGERLLPGMVERVAAARRLLGGAVELEVDGGVDAAVAARLRGVADRLVVGRMLLGAGDLRSALAALRAPVLEAQRR